MRIATNKTVLSGFAVALAAAALLLAGCGRPDAATELARAHASFDGGDLRTASVHLSNVLQQEPENPDARVLRGRIALAFGDYRGARDQFERAQRLGAPEPAVIAGMAEALLRGGEAERALELLGAAGADSDDAETATLRGEALLAVGRLEDARLSLEAAAARAPESVPNMVARARLAAASGAPQQASLLLERALELAPRDPLAHRARAELALAAGSNAAAAADLEQAADLYAAAGAVFQEASVLATLLQVRFLEGDAEAAGATAARLKQRVPDTPMSYYAEALVAYRQGDLPRAVQAAQRAVNAQPGNPRLLTLLGAAQLGQGNVEQAEQQLLRAISLAPADDTAVKLLAETRLRQQRPAAAAAALESLGTRLEADPQGLMLRALVRLQTGDVERATADLTKSSELLAEGGAAAESRLAVDLELARIQAVNDVGGARDTLRRMVASRPDALPLRLALGRTELRLGDEAAALATAAALQRDHPQSAAGFALEAEAHLVHGRHEAAAAAYGHASSREPLWELVNAEAAALQRAGQAGEAVARVGAWLEANPEHIQGRLALAVLHQQQERPESALAEYERVLELEEHNVVAMNNAAWLRFEAGLPGALALAERARDASPENPAVLDTLGWILVGEGRPERALGFLERAMQLAPRSLEIRYHVAQTLARLGRTDEARTLLESLLAEGSSFAGREAAGALLESLNDQ